METKKIILAFLLAAVLPALVFSPAKANVLIDNPDEEFIDDGLLVCENELAPDFTVEMFDGSMVKLSELQGNVVLLNFWATWCPPCRAELARVQEDIIDRFAGREFVFLPVSRGETREKVEEFRNATGYSFPMGLDPEESVFKLYAEKSIPRNFIIDRQGVITAIELGYSPEEFDKLIETIENTLNQ